MPPLNGLEGANGSADAMPADAGISLLSLDPTMCLVINEFSSQFWKR